MTDVQLLPLLLLLVLLLLLATVGRKLSELVKYDVAYGCFLFCGLVSLLYLVMIADFIPMSTQTALLIGLVVAFPLMIVSIVAMVVGISLTIFLRHHKPLVILTFLTVIVAFVIPTQFGPEVLHALVLILYIVMTIGLSFRWFLILRKRWGKNI